MASDVDGVRLRLAALEDAVAIADIYAPYVRETAISFELEPPSATLIASRIVEVSSFHPWLVLEQGGAVRAYAYATRMRQRPAYDWIAETSIYVERSAQRRGFGERLYSALLDLLAMQGLSWAYGVITVAREQAREGDSPSQRFHARLGFERIARLPTVGFKHRRWWDIEWWRFALAEPDEPERPRPIHDPGLREAIAERLAWP